MYINHKNGHTVETLILEKILLLYNYLYIYICILTWLIAAVWSFVVSFTTGLCARAVRNTMRIGFILFTQIVEVIHSLRNVYIHIHIHVHISEHTTPWLRRWDMNLSETCNISHYRMFSKNDVKSMFFGTFEKLVNSCVYELSFVLNSNVHKWKENKEFNIIELCFFNFVIFILEIDIQRDRIIILWERERNKNLNFF